MTQPPAHPRGLYLITPDTADTTGLLRRLEPVLACGPALVQWRCKQADPDLRREQAGAVADACARHGVPMIVNDDVALAAELGAAGIHLGRDDAGLAQARASLGPHALIGASCYDQLALAQGAVAAGASYVAFGAFFPSPTKPHAVPASLDLLRDSAGLGVPRVAIGGIRVENARSLVAAGADLLAVISGVFDAPDPAGAARAFQSAFQEHSP